MRTLYVPVTPDPSSVEGALAGMARVWERGGFDRVVLLVSPLARRGDVERAKWWAERLAGAGAVEEAEAPGPGDPGAVGRLERLLSGCGGGAVLVSAASRWLSAALALAAPRDSCSIVYVSFYFGPWTGLVYPYTPWRLEPLHVLAGPQLSGGRGDGAAAARAPPAWGAGELLGGGLPPLRAAVAEAARRLNMAYAGGCRRLRVRLAGLEALIDLGDPGVLAEAAEELARGVADLKLPGGRGGGGLRSLAAFTGLAELHGLEAVAGRRVYVDTSLVYYGVHVYRWEGLGVAVPECAVAEAEKRLAEAVKNGRIDSPGDAMAVAAWLGLHDLLGSGAPVLPTPPGPCDTAMAKADPLLLDGAVLATADDGAYRYWSSHPVSKLATPRKASFNAYRQRWRGSGLSTARVARLYYAIHQALLLLQLLARQGALPGFSLECSDGESPGLEEVADWLASRLGLQ